MFDLHKHSCQLSAVSCQQKKVFSFIVFVLFALVSFSFSGCTSTGLKKKPPFEYMPNMMDSPAVKAQEEPMRVPPQGTVPENFEFYPYTKEQGDMAGAALKNPLTRTKENFLRGQKVFNTYCIVCHGSGGLGDGTIVPKFPRPPSLNSEKVVAWSDGRIYHVITAGQNLMPAYATQIKPEDRWAAILYVRALQRSAHPTPEDIDLLKKELKEGKIR